MRQKSVRQKEIAEQLGVSVATVSRVLNDQPGVGFELRERVLNLISQTGYTPDMVARSLATARTHTVAFVVDKVNYVATEDPFYSLIMVGAEAYLSQCDYHILLAAVESKHLTHPQTFSAVRQGRVDGLILAGPHFSTPFILHMLTNGVPVVLVDNCLSQMPVNCVLSDDKGGAYMATRHLIEHDHQHIVFLSGPRTWVSNDERALGYVQALTEVGLEPHIIQADDTTIATGEAMMREALTQIPDLTAVCAVNDAVASGAIRAANKAGRHVPDDVAVIGFDDLSWTAINSPPLSTVHTYKRRIGQLAAQCLLDAIQDPHAVPIKTVVSTTLVIRQSCGCPEPPEDSHASLGLEASNGSVAKGGG